MIQVSIQQSQFLLVWIYQLIIIGQTAKMSLLSNLLEFSSVNSASKQDRQQRSNSASNHLLSNTLVNSNYTSLFEETSLQKCRKSLSKSLSKLSMSGVKPDPKTRVLHKLVQQLNRKCRKNYYAFFVVLQQMKKNNISPIRPKASTENLHYCNKNIIQLSQTIEILSLKVYQKQTKGQCFSRIKDYAHRKQALTLIVSILDNYSDSVEKRRFFTCLKKIQAVYAKVDYFVLAIKGALGTLANRMEQQREDTEFDQNLQLVHDVFGQIAKFANSKKQSQVKTASKPRIQNEKKSESFQTPAKKTKESNHSSLDILQNVSSMELSHFGPNEQVKTNRKLGSIFDAALAQHNYLTERGQKDNSKLQSPIKLCKHISPMNKNLRQVSLIKKNTGSIWTAYCIETCIEQEPLEAYRQTESKSTPCCKIYPDYYTQRQIGDIYDKNDLFMGIKEVSTSSLSRGLYINGSISNSTYAIGTIVDKLQKDPLVNCFQSRIDNNQGRTKSHIIYGTPMFHSDSQKLFVESQNSRENHDIHFGSEAVNFKNSLVSERQSMRQEDQIRGLFGGCTPSSENCYDRDNRNVPQISRLDEPSQRRKISFRQFMQATKTGLNNYSKLPNHVKTTTNNQDKSNYFKSYSNGPSFRSEERGCSNQRSSKYQYRQDMQESVRRDNAIETVYFDDESCENWNCSGIINQKFKRQTFQKKSKKISININELRPYSSYSKEVNPTSGHSQWMPTNNSEASLPLKYSMKREKNRSASFASYHNTFDFRNNHEPTTKVIFPISPIQCGYSASRGQTQRPVRDTTIKETFDRDDLVFKGAEKPEKEKLSQTKYRGVNEFIKLKSRREYKPETK